MKKRTMFLFIGTLAFSLSSFGSVGLEECKSLALAVSKRVKLQKSTHDVLLKRCKRTPEKTGYIFNILKFNKELEYRANPKIMNANSRALSSSINKLVQNVDKGKFDLPSLEIVENQKKDCLERAKGLSGRMRFATESVSANCYKSYNEKTSELKLLESPKEALVDTKKKVSDATIEDGSSSSKLGTTENLNALSSKSKTGSDKGLSSTTSNEVENPVQIPTETEQREPASIVSQQQSEKSKLAAANLISQSKESQQQAVVNTSTPQVDALAANEKNNSSSSSQEIEKIAEADEEVVAGMNSASTSQDENWEVSDHKSIDKKDGYYVLTGDNGTEFPVSAQDFSSVEEHINKCIGKKQDDESNQDRQDRCVKEGIEFCKTTGQYCSSTLDAFIENDRIIESEPSRKAGISSEKWESALSADVELGDVASCIEYLSVQDTDLQNAGYVQGTKILRKEVKLLGSIETGDVRFSDRLAGKFYADTNSCEEVFNERVGGRQVAFTNVEGKLKVNNVLDYCLDVLQASLLSNPNGDCQQAFHSLRGGKASGIQACEDNKYNSQNVQDVIEDSTKNSIAIMNTCREKLTGQNGLAPTEVELQACYDSGNNALAGLTDQKKPKTECTSAYTAVKNCLEREKKQYEIAKGCVGLQKIAEGIKGMDGLDRLDDGETSYQSLDSVIKCTLHKRYSNGSSPVYAIDYIACRRAAYWYNGAFLTTDLASPIVGNAMEVYREGDIQSEMQKELAEGGVTAQTAGLRAQKRRYDSKANSESVKGALQGSKAIAMFANMALYPTPNIVSEKWCGEGSENHLGLKEHHACGVSDMVAVNKAIDGTLEDELFANQKMKQIMLNKGFESLSQAIVHAIVAGTYKKRAKLVGEVEDTLANADFVQPENQFELGPSFCAQNPTLPSCQGPGAGRVANNAGVDFSFGGIQPQGGGNLDPLGDADLGEVDGNNNAIAPAGAAQNELKDILATDSDGKFGDSFNKVSAAKAGSAPGGGGSSGGGGGGGGGAGGGGSSGPGKAKAGPGSSNSLGDKSFAKYTAGGNGKFASGGSIRKKSKSKNPFAGLSGKRRNRKIASQVEKQLLPKKVKLFDAISKRYAAVSKERLEYAPKQPEKNTQ